MAREYKIKWQISKPICFYNKCEFKVLLEEINYNSMICYETQDKTVRKSQN